MRVDPELFSRMSVERHLWRHHQLASDALCDVGIDPTRDVDALQFPLLKFGSLTKLDPLELKLTRERLHLGPARDVLTSSHRERATEQARKSSDSHHPGAWVCASCSKNEGHIGDEPIAYAKHGGAEASTADIAMSLVAAKGPDLVMVVRQLGRASASLCTLRRPADGHKDEVTADQFPLGQCRPWSMPSAEGTQSASRACRRPFPQN